MARKSHEPGNEKPGYGKLLNAWDRPRDAGDAIGCLATTFTFTPMFFEEECLGRFVHFETSSQEDGPLYLVEREEKLAQLSCAAALVDQNHCRGRRSLRWDMLPIRPRRGIMHAKVAILRWSRVIRLIVTSANLTEDGYRRNREVFGVLDYRPHGEAPTECLRDVVNFLREVIAQVDPGTGAVGPASQRCLGFLDSLQRAAEELSAEPAHPKRGHVTVKVVCAGPGRQSPFAALDETWPAATRPDSAHVVSPFFDPPESENYPAKRIWDLLRQRGEVSVSYYLTTEELPGHSGALFVRAPQSVLDKFPSGQPAAQTLLYQLSDELTRPLHAKGLWLDGTRWAAYLIGSSNFTTAGMGLGRHPNYEANLLYLVDASRDPEGYAALQSSFPAGELIDAGQELHWRPREDDSEDTPNEQALVLPAAFGPAVYATDEDQRANVELTLHDRPPAGWRLLHEDEQATFYDDAAWRKVGEPCVIRLPWSRDMPPHGFAVTWDASNGTAWWPINVESTSSLPPPAELRDIPLDVLINILTSARPLHLAMRSWIRRRHRDQGGQGEAIVVDPHKRVDTSAFLLQRTRRVSWALHALLQRLARPVPTQESLNWRLHGPIGVATLAKAILKEGRSDEERAFLLTELALELGRFAPQEAKGCLSAEDVNTEVRKVIGWLHDQVVVTEMAHVPNLERYVCAAFKEAIT